MHKFKEKSERTLLNLRKLFSETDSIYEELSFKQTDSSHLTAEADLHMLSGIQYFIRCMVPYEYNNHLQTFQVSPINIKFSTENKKDLSVEVYGSFSSKMPGALQCFLSNKDPDALTSTVSKDCEYEFYSKHPKLMIKDEQALSHLE